MAAFPFKADTYVESLRNGLPAPVFGLNINLLGPSPPEKLLSAYRKLVTELEAALPSFVHLYPDHAMHITAASPVPFTVNSLEDLGEREVIQDAWTRAFAEYIPRHPDWPREPFEIVFVRPVLDPAAGYFWAEDASGSVTRLRKVIGDAQRDFIPRCQGMSPETLAKAAFKIPQIIHSTFLRFGSAVASSPLSGDDIRMWFEEAAARAWTPCSIRVDDVRLVLETEPYMHSRTHEVLAVAPFR
ncbi:hypothetical protein DFJ74DRAFT_91985 [Hyaloraphidium curvatum]|nr:hypothetical protein DFJ74DRAFT_91985 [Hyaloraphidium curvatum]